MSLNIVNSQGDSDSDDIESDLDFGAPQKVNLGESPFNIADTYHNFLSLLQKEASHQKRPFGASIDPTAKVVRVDSATQLKQKPKVVDATEPQTVLPLAAVKRIINADPDVKTLASTVPVAIAKSTELFIQAFAKSSFRFSRAAKRKTLQITDVNTAIELIPVFRFLGDGIFEIDRVSLEKSRGGGGKEKVNTKTSNKGGKKKFARKSKFQKVPSGFVPITKVFQNEEETLFDEDEDDIFHQDSDFSESSSDDEDSDSLLFEQPKEPDNDIEPEGEN